MTSFQSSFLLYRSRYLSLETTTPLYFAAQSRMYLLKEILKITKKFMTDIYKRKWNSSQKGNILENTSSKWFWWISANDFF